ncbi:BnaCnng50470D [Brassica napus]|uniref:BnaCnng50470D protein n=1 Tax=Brassica napus TaxID=3708 RepID=A0A078JKM1_BRANA|nr:BnaCnng50470D [Brassica napus]
MDSNAGSSLARRRHRPFSLSVRHSCTGTRSDF